MIRAGLFNFSKGEIGPELYGRIDVPAYSAGVKQARNVTILKYGGLQRRMGQRVAYELREPEDGWDADSSQARLVPFEYSIEQSYILLMRQAQMNPLAFGGAVLEEELAIEDVTNETQAKLTIPFHEYEVGDEIWPTGIEGALGEFLNERVWTVVEVVDANNFRIDADTSALAAFTAADGGITRVAAPPPPPPPPPVPPPPPPPVLPPLGGPGGGGGGGGRDPYLRLNQQ